MTLYLRHRLILAIAPILFLAALLFGGSGVVRGNPTFELIDGNGMRLSHAEQRICEMHKCDATFLGVSERSEILLMLNPTDS